MAATTPSPAAAPSSWIHGAPSDLLIGCGGLLSLVGLFYLGSGPGLLDAQPTYLIPVLFFAISLPHYGGTLLRVYETREDIDTYRRFAVYATLGVCAWFVAGVAVPIVGSILVTVYLTWSTWHYTGQNYGLTMMFLGRRGVDVPVALRRALRGSFVASYGLIFLDLHAMGDHAYRAMNGTHVDFISLGLPAQLGNGSFLLVMLGYVLCVGFAVIALLRRASLRTLVPAFLLMFTQAVWFAVPHMIMRMGLGSGQWSVSYQGNFILWIALAHAAQYLWITTYFARSGPRWPGRGRYYAKVLASGCLVWTVPLLLFVPVSSGNRLASSGLFLLVASAVNIHHFILDGAIWKLRSQKVASVLLRDGAASEAAVPPPIGPARRFFKPALWAVGAACCALQVFVLYGVHVQLPSALAAGDVPAAHSILRAASLVGQEPPGQRMELGSVLQAQGDRQSAFEQYRRALALDSRSVRALASLGTLLLDSEQYEEAYAYFEQGLALDPDYWPIEFNMSVGLVLQGRIAEAKPHLTRTVELAPGNAKAQEMLANALLTEGDAHAALAHYERALALDPNLGSARENIGIARSIVESGGDDARSSK